MADTSLPPDVQNAANIGTGIGSFLGNMLNPVIGSINSTTQTTKSEPTKSNMGLLAVVAVAGLLLLAYFVSTGSTPKNS